LFKGTPNFAKQGMMFAQSSSTTWEGFINVLPWAAPRTWHGSPKQGVGTVHSIEGFGQSFAGGNVIING
jgi:hypothetical protein